MGKEYQICELEEKGESEQFTVAAVPVIWIVCQMDGSFLCYWPKKNVERKIRQQQPPEEEGNYYKCRILFDGAKFRSYKKAKAAEITAQNSSVLDWSTVTSDQNKLDSTMDFDVCDVSDTDMTTESDTFDSDNDDDEDNQIVGNDSFEYNKSMLWKRVNFQGSGKGFESVPTLPEYESFFRTENDFLTSTAVDESGSSFVDDNVDRSVDPQIQTADGQILAKIKSIESKVSSFFEFIRNELNDVKGLVLRDIDRKKPRQSDESLIAPGVVLNDGYVCKKRDTRDFAVEEGSAKPIIVLSDETVMMPFKTVHTVPNDGMLSKEISENISIDEFVTTSDIAVHPSNIEVIFDRGHGHFTSETTEPSNGENIAEQNRTFVLLPDLSLVNDDDGGENSNAVNDDGGDNSNAVNDRNDYQSIENIIVSSSDDDSVQLPDTVQLPVDTKEQYKTNEDILELVEGASSDLVDRMEPLTDENETDYMNRIVFVAFTHNFLLEHLSWRGENGRINPKHGNFLKCWKKSYEKEFGTDDKNARVIKHIRRLKGTKRAAKKRAAAEKPAATGNSQPKKQKKTP